MNQKDVTVRSRGYHALCRFRIIQAAEFGPPCALKAFHILENIGDYPHDEDWQHVGIALGHDLVDAEDILRRQHEDSITSRRNPRYSLLAEMDRAWPRKPILKALAQSVSDGIEALEVVVQRHVEDEDQVDEVIAAIMRSRRDLQAEMDWAWPDKAKLKGLVREANTLEEGRRLLIEVIRHHADEDRVAEITADIMRHKAK